MTALLDDTGGVTPDAVTDDATAQAGEPVLDVTASPSTDGAVTESVIARPAPAEPASAEPASAEPASAEADPGEPAPAGPASAPEVAAGGLDPVAAAATELARAAAIEVGGSDVGDHLGVSVEDAGVVTHVFAATLAGYRGWHWAVTIARASDSTTATVDEVVLLPGDDALRAPIWVPWAQRIRPGDLGAGDVLPADPDDSRLVPSYWSDGDPELEDDLGDDVRTLADEVGLGRVRVLSRDGRVDAAERWRESDFGPDVPMAKQAPANCGTCGFLVPVRGSMSAAFGVCANEFSAADARVVSVEFGCGAHSEAGVDLAGRNEPAGQVYDSGELNFESTEPAPDRVVEPTDPTEPAAEDGTETIF